MHSYFQSAIITHTSASSIAMRTPIQDLWSGYGKIWRILLEDGSVNSVVVKHIQAAGMKNHVRGWNTNIGHHRKVKSYEVETEWYRAYSNQCRARLPECFAIEEYGAEILIILEDLDSAGYPLRKNSVEWSEIESCLKWLAHFHASYLGQEPNGLWDIGTYWHLATRPDELQVLSDQKLKDAASIIDKKLNSCTFKTFVHGDAKLANFCFSPDGKVSGVDFQYVGGGCGMKDVAYFIGSCMSEEDCEYYESEILDTYFKYLQGALDQPNKALEAEWRSLYRVAWADFHRFLKGWSPAHWKINSYSERVTDEVINSLI